MLNAILWSQWKPTRGLVLITSIIAFALPVSSITITSTLRAQDVTRAMQQYGALYPMLAALTGLLVAMSAWAPDHAGRHTYALSLPISRSSYAGMRFVAGAAFIGVTAIALLLGALLVALGAAIPEGLHAYPFRFALAALVSYSVFFAISSSTSQTAGVILGMIATLLLTQFVLTMADVDYNVLEKVIEFLAFRPGLFSVFAGRWMLIDA